jgi:hypothetical protein
MCDTCTSPVAACYSTAVAVTPIHASIVTVPLPCQWHDTGFGPLRRKRVHLQALHVWPWRAKGTQPFSHVHLRMLPRPSLYLVQAVVRYHTGTLFGKHTARHHLFRGQLVLPMTRTCNRTPLQISWDHASAICGIYARAMPTLHGPGRLNQAHSSSAAAQAYMSV